MRSRDNTEAAVEVAQGATLPAYDRHLFKEAQRDLQKIQVYSKSLSSLMGFATQGTGNLISTPNISFVRPTIEAVEPLGNPSEVVAAVGQLRDDIRSFKADTASRLDDLRSRVEGLERPPAGDVDLQRVVEAADAARYAPLKSEKAVLAKLGAEKSGESWVEFLDSVATSGVRPTGIGKTVLDALRGPDPAVRAAAARALLQIAGKDSRAPLEQALAAEVNPFAKSMMRSCLRVTHS